MGKQEVKLNTDIPGKISELSAVLKEFRLKQDIFKIIFRGKGLEFDGYREFTPDDDAQEIDWKASSRGGQKLLVKKYKEERDMKIMFMIDVGANMVFGSSEKLKCEYAAELAAAFSEVLIANNDKVGFLFFNEGTVDFIDFKNGKKHFHIFVDFLTKTETYIGKNSNINAALDFAMDLIDNSVLAVILISDFLSVNLETEKKLNLLSHRVETLAFSVNDPLDFDFPDVEGEVSVEDPDTKQQIIVNPRIVKAEYKKNAMEHRMFVRKVFEKTGIDVLELTTDKSFSVPLANFIKMRLLLK